MTPIATQKPTVTSNSILEAEVVKPAIDKPAGKGLEDLVRHIGWKMQPDADRQEPYTLEDFANLIRRRYKLTMPVAPQLSKMLTEMGIEMVWFEQQKNVNVDGWNIYDLASHLWQIHIPSGLGIFEPRAILHETFEIVFWRCYHRIPWFAAWAKEMKIIDPHKSADEFAFLVMLPRRKFCNLARRLECDIWQIAPKCAVHPSVCFSAVSRYMNFPFPFFHLRLSFGAKPDQMSMRFDDEWTQAKIAAKTYKPPKDEELDPYWDNLSPEQLRLWLPLTHFEKFRPKGEFLDIPLDDVTALALQRYQTVIAQTDRVAGYQLEGPVSAIARPGEKSQVYVQVVPCGYEALLRAKEVDPLTVWPAKPTSPKPTSARVAVSHTTV